MFRQRWLSTDPCGQCVFGRRNHRDFPKAFVASQLQSKAEAHGIIPKGINKQIKAHCPDREVGTLTLLFRDSGARANLGGYPVTPSQAVRIFIIVLCVRGDKTKWMCFL